MGVEKIEFTNVTQQFTVRPIDATPLTVEIKKKPPAPPEQASNTHILQFKNGPKSSTQQASNLGSKQF